MSLGRVIRYQVRLDLGSGAGRAVSMLAVLLSVVAATGASVVQGFQGDVASASVSARDALLLPNAVALILLPVLAVLSGTAEWSKRRAVLTFCLVPNRRLVLAAKGISIAAAAVVLLVVITLSALAATWAVALARDYRWELTGFWGPGDGVFGFAVQIGLLVSVAFALALLTSSTSLALVAYFVGTTVVEASLGAALGDRRNWVSLDAAVQALSAAEPGVAVVQAGVALGFWLALPALLGAAAFLSREVK